MFRARAEGQRCAVLTTMPYHLNLQDGFSTETALLSSHIGSPAGRPCTKELCAPSQCYSRARGLALQSQYRKK